MLSPSLQSYAETIANGADLTSDERLVIRNLNELAESRRCHVEARQSLRMNLATVTDTLRCSTCNAYPVKVEGDLCSACWRQAIR